jgi:hypothetical protein
MGHGKHSSRENKRLTFEKHVINDKKQIIGPHLH